MTGLPASYTDAPPQTSSSVGVDLHQDRFDAGWRRAGGSLRATAFSMGPLIEDPHTGWLVLAGTSGIMVLAYTVRRLPFAVRNASSTLFNIPESIEEASISLGVSPLMTFFKVILPAMRASLISAAILMWVTTISELSASVVVYTGGLETMPITIFRQVDGGRLGLASAYGAALVSVILLPIVVAIKVFRINLFSSK